MPDPQPEGVTLPTLVVTGGPLDGTAYPLSMTSRAAVLGSSMDADVQIMLGNVEPSHAQLTFGPSGLSIADGGSATGTFVNGEKVEGEQPLQEGDRICLGPPGAKDSAKLVVKLPGGGGSAAEPAAPVPPAIPMTNDGIVMSERRRRVRLNVLFFLLNHIKVFLINVRLTMLFQNAADGTLHFLLLLLELRLCPAPFLGSIRRHFAPVDGKHVFTDELHLTHLRVLDLDRKTA